MKKENYKFLSVKFKDLNARKFGATLFEDIKIHEIHNIVSNHYLEQFGFDYNPSYLRLIYRGKNLEPEDSFSTCNYKKEDYIHIVLRMRGDYGRGDIISIKGFCGSEEFDFTSGKKKIKKKIFF